MATGSFFVAAASGLYPAVLTVPDAAVAIRKETRRGPIESGL